MAAIFVMAAIGAWAVTTHRISYVITHGISMNPVYYAGDLVVVVKENSYEVGQIAAYHGAGGVETLHRIIGGDPATGFVFKGDNNQSIDEFNPTAEELIGRAVLHVPQGGKWLRPLLSPTGLGMLGFLFVSGGAATVNSRRDIPRGRRKKRAKGMAGQGGSWAAAATVAKAVNRLHPILRVLACATALCAICGLLLGVLGWMKPATQTNPTSSQPRETMTFSYSADVKPSAAYDGTTAYSPDPIYRRLTDFVNLQLQYQGDPGRISVDARLSSESGWHSTIQLSQARQFAAERYTSTVLLDLGGIDDRAKAAAKAIGTNLGQILIQVTAHVEHSDGILFEPQLPLGLDQLQLTLTRGSASLVVSQSGSTTGGGIFPRQVSVLGRDLMTAGEARKYAVWLLLFAVAGVIGIGLAAMRHVPLASRAQIQRRYGHLLVPVEPVTSKQGETVVTVASVPALVKLAEKYGQMILTWTRPDGADDFVVRDDGVLYRYRVVPPRPVAAKPPLSGVPHPARRAQKSAALGIASVISSPTPAGATESDAPTQPELADDPKIAHEAPTDLKPEPDSTTESKAESDSTAGPEAKPGSTTDLQAETDLTAGPKAEPSPKAESDSTADATSAREDTTDLKAEPAADGSTADEAAPDLKPAPESDGDLKTAHGDRADGMAGPEPAAELQTTGDEKQTAEPSHDLEPSVKHAANVAPSDELKAEPPVETSALAPEVPEPATAEREESAEPKAVEKPEIAATEPEKPEEPQPTAEVPATAPATTSKTEPEETTAKPEETVAAESDEAVSAKSDKTVAATPDEIVAAEAVPAPVQPARRPRKRAPKARLQLEAAPAAPQTEMSAEPQTQSDATLAAPAKQPGVSPEAADQPHPEEQRVTAVGAMAVREKEQEAESAPGPQKQPPRRKPRTRKPAATPEAEAAAEPKAETAPRPIRRKSPAAQAKTPAAPKHATEITAAPKATTETTTGPEAVTVSTTVPEAAAETTAATEAAAEIPAATEAAAESITAPESTVETVGAGAAETGGKQKAEILAMERKAAEELAERNLALEQAITRKAEEDQAAADRARKERVAKRTAERDPVFDFLPKKD